MAEYNSAEENFRSAEGFHEEKFLGKGKFEPVILYRTDDKICSKIVLKFICGKIISESRDEESIKENFRELIGHVHDPNVVAYLDFLLHEERKQLGIKMEYMQNGSLHNLMTRGVEIPWSVTISILRDVSTGMAYLHTDLPGNKQIILHDNLHLNNILLTENFIAKVTDYGLKSTYAITRSYAPGYQSYENVRFKAPERILNPTDANTEKTDIYSFGIVVYAMLQGSTNPYEPMTNDEIETSLKKGHSVVDTDRLSRDAPPVLIKILLQATEYDPVHRAPFKDMHRMLEVEVPGRDHLQHDIDVLKDDLVNHPYRPHVPPAPEEDDEPPLKPASIPSYGPTGNYNNSSQTFGSQPLQQPSDELHDGRPQHFETPAKKYVYNPLEGEPSEECSSSRRNEYACTSSTSSESVQSEPITYPPRIEPADIGDDEDDCIDIRSTSGQSDQSSTVLLPPGSTMNDVTNSMGSLTIQPDPRLNQGIQNGIPSMPITNLPNFHNPTLPSYSSVPGQYMQSPGNSFPAYQPNMPNVQSFINGMPQGMQSGGSGPQIVNIDGKSTVMYGNNTKIVVSGNNRRKERPPHTKEEELILGSARVLTDKELDMVAENLGKKWRELGRGLKFSKGQLDAFSSDYQGLKETIYQMLLRWKEKGAGIATVGVLAKELDAVNRRSIMRKLKA